MRSIGTLASVLAISLAVALPLHAKTLPGLAEISGNVAGAKSAIVPVYIYNTDKHVGYAVFAVDGQYRAVDLLPGKYEVTVRKDGLDMAPVTLDIAANAHAKADLSPKAVPAKPNYVGGRAMDDYDIEPYDKVYPPAPGRAVVERTCMVCHGVNFLQNRFLDRDGWDLMITYMTEGAAFRKYGIEKGPSMFPPSWLSADDRKLVLDYLSTNFGADATPRVVKQENEPMLDPAALSKAQYIEYRFLNTKDQPKRWTQEVHFDRDGNVYATDRGHKPTAAIVKVDPRTGETKDYPVPEKGNLPHGITVDFDGTVWWAGDDVLLGHLDPKTGLQDLYKAPTQGVYGHTPVFDSKGDLWFSMLLGNKIGKWDRATDKITYYEEPEARARPYGLTIDSKDRIWWVEYHTAFIGSFDPATKQFKRYPIKSSPAQMRRLGVDRNDIIWYGVYGSTGKKGKLGRLDPKTGETIERDLPIDFSTPYDAWDDEKGNIWASTDNYMVRFNEATEKFTVYPIPERTDQPKVTITRDGAIWYAPRAAGHNGYGGAAAVLYPDKDNIPTLGAFYSITTSHNRTAKFNGKSVKVTGVVKMAPANAENQELVVAHGFVGKPLAAPVSKREDPSAAGALAD